MKIIGILDSQTNQIILAIKAMGWSLSDFSIKEISGVMTYVTQDNVSRLVHTATNYYFTFDNGYTKGSYDFYSEYSPAEKERTVRNNDGSFEEQFVSFQNWLKYLDREVKAADLWKDIVSDDGNIKQIVSGASDEENSEFTDTEKDYIVKGIEEIKQYLLNAHNAPLELIQGQLDYLVESSNRLGRKDWKNVLISVFFSFLVSGIFSVTSASEIFHFVYTVLRKVLIQQILLAP